MPPDIFKDPAGGAVQVATQATQSGGITKFFQSFDPISLLIQVGVALLVGSFKTKPEPLGVRSHNLTGGREEARFIVGEVRIPFEPIDGTALPRPLARDNHIRLIGAISEQSIESVEKRWMNGDELSTTKVGNAYVPPVGSGYRIDRSWEFYGTPDYVALGTEFCYQFRPMLKADGTQVGSETSTSDNPTYAIPSNRQYNYCNGGADSWGRASATCPNSQTTLTRDPIPDDPPIGYALDESVTPPVYKRELGDDTLPVTYNQQRFIFNDYSLEVKEIDPLTYKMNGMSWEQADFIQPFFQQSDFAKRLYKGIPSVDLLVKGIKLTVPGKSEKEYSNNPIAILYWLDTFYRGLPASKIDTASFTEAFNDCDEELVYRCNTGVPDNTLGENGEFYVRTDTPRTLYQKKEGAWVNQGAVSGDYNWLIGKCTGHEYRMKRYSCNLEIVSGENVDDLYRKVLITCDGVRYEKDGKIHYRVGKHRATKLTLLEEDILEAKPVQTWQPRETRINKFVARMRQSEQNDYLPDTVPFEDTAVITRDGETREQEFVLDGVTNPLQASNLVSVLLKKARLFRSWPLIAGYLDDMAQFDLQPYDIIAINKNELGLVNQLVIVLQSMVMPNGTVELYVQEYEEGLFDPVFALPELKPKPFRYTDLPPAYQLSGLSTDEIAVAIPGGRTIRLDATWNPSDVEATEIRARKIGTCAFIPSIHVPVTVNTFLNEGVTLAYLPSIQVPVNVHNLVTERFDGSLLPSIQVPISVNNAITKPMLGFQSTTLSVDESLYYRNIGANVFKIGPSDTGHANYDANADYVHSQVQRWGYWLQFQYPPIWQVAASRNKGQTQDDAAKQMQQLQRVNGPGTNTIPILGTENDNGRAFVFWRFGLTGFTGDNCLLGFLTQGSTATSTDFTTPEMFDAEQLTNWRLVLYDSADNHIIITLPTTAQDSTEPYNWPVAGIRTFLENAWSNNLTVRTYFIDIRRALVDYDYEGWSGLQVNLPSIQVPVAVHTFVGTVEARRFTAPSIVANYDGGMLMIKHNALVQTSTSANFSALLGATFYTSITRNVWCRRIEFSGVTETAPLGVQSVVVEFTYDSSEQRNPLLGTNVTAADSANKTVVLMYPQTDTNPTRRGTAIYLNDTNCTVAYSIDSRSVIAQFRFTPNASALQVELRTWLGVVRQPGTGKPGGNQPTTFAIVDDSNPKVDLSTNRPLLRS